MLLVHTHMKSSKIAIHVDFSNKMFVPSFMTNFYIDSMLMMNRCSSNMDVDVLSLSVNFMYLFGSTNSVLVVHLDRMYLGYVSSLCVNTIHARESTLNFLGGLHHGKR